MKTHELSKELDYLARSVRALTSEAGEALAKTLELERRRGLKPTSKFEPRALTLAEISSAIHAVTLRPAQAVELRKDVFERRIERNSVMFADQFELAVKTGRPAPTGVRFAPRYTRLREGVRSLYEAVPKFGKTPINADGCAWSRAADLVIGRIVEAYGYNAIYSHACRAVSADNYIARSRLEEKIRSRVQDWVEANTTILCDVDDAGRIIRFNGLDPAPFIELRRIVESGQTDPLGIIAAA